MKNSDYTVINQDQVELQPNGFMNVMANLTRTGIFVYSRVDPDGTLSTVRQLRMPDEVFSPETLATLIGLPITNNHPDELISPENASDFIVGMSSDQPKRVFAPVQNTDTEEEYVQQRLTFFEKDTIDEVQDGTKSELSLGYTVELDEAPGLYKDRPYDVIQRNIRYNHLSLVRKARGGRDCKVLLDDKEVEIQLDGVSFIEDENINGKDEGEDMKIFKYGSKEFNVEDDVHALLTSVTANMDGLTDGLASKKSEVEKLLAKCDELKDQIKVQQDSEDKEAFSKAVKTRVILEGKAGKVLGSEVSLDGLTDLEIKKKVVNKLRPTTVLDDKSEEYVDARFEICIEDSADDKPQNKDEQNVGNNVQNSDGDDEDIVAIARKKSWEASKELYKVKA